jgi:hypothetical protein
MSGVARRITRSALVLLALGAIGTESARAQWFNGGGYIGIGLARTATGELDDALEASGYPAFGPAAVGVGIGAYMTVANRVLLGAEWNGIIKGNQEHQGRKVFLGGGYGTLGAGYAVNVSPRLRIYPRLGLGGGGLGLTFESIEPSVGFDDVLDDPDAQADLTRGFQPSLTREHGVVDVGAGAEFLPSRNGRGTLLGLRLGVVLAPSSGSWRLNQRHVTGGPAATIAGPYIRMVFGAGAWR